MQVVGDAMSQLKSSKRNAVRMKGEKSVHIKNKTERKKAREFPYSR
jgi:hypothetical protein